MDITEDEITFEADWYLLTNPGVAGAVRPGMIGSALQPNRDWRRDWRRGVRQT